MTFGLVFGLKHVPALNTEPELITSQELPICDRLHCQEPTAASRRAKRTGVPKGDCRTGKPFLIYVSFQAISSCSSWAYHSVTSAAENPRWQLKADCLRSPRVQEGPSFIYAVHRPGMDIPGSCTWDRLNTDLQGSHQKKKIWVTFTVFHYLKKKSCCITQGPLNKSSYYKHKVDLSKKNHSITV